MKSLEKSMKKEWGKTNNGNELYLSGIVIVTIQS